MTFGFVTRVLKWRHHRLPFSFDSIFDEIKHNTTDTSLAQLIKERKKRYTRNVKMERMIESVRIMISMGRNF